MADVAEVELRAEILRLNKVVNALMDRAERSTRAQGSEFSTFQRMIMLEDQVQRRTEELQAVIRENQKIHSALSESEARFRGLVNQSLVGIATVEQGRLTYANPRFAEMFGYSMEEIPGLVVLALATPGDRGLMAEQMRQRLLGEAERVEYLFHGLRRNGEVIDVECHSSSMEVGGRVVLIGLMLDVTERLRVEREVRALQERLREQAIHDPLTGLYNRLPLNEFFDRELSQAGRRNRPIGVVMGDLDHFKRVNDKFGHMAGDEGLKHFADLIRSSYRAGDILCRYGGEEFVILLPDMPLEVAVKRTESLRRRLAETPLVWGAARICLTASFGIALFPEHGETRDALIAAADRALYAAKSGGRNQVRIELVSLPGKAESAEVQVAANAAESSAPTVRP